MARIIVKSNAGKILIDERDVLPEHIDDQLLDRIAWAIADRPQQQPHRPAMRRRRAYEAIWSARR